MSDTIGGRPERTTGRSAELSERGRIQTAGERTQGASPPARRKAGLLPISLVVTNARYGCGHVRIQAHDPHKTFAWPQPSLRHKILPHQVSEHEDATASCTQQQCHLSFFIISRLVVQINRFDLHIGVVHHHEGLIEIRDHRGKEGKGKRTRDRRIDLSSDGV